MSRSRLEGDRGQASVEHAALVALIALLLVAGGALAWAPSIYNGVHSGLRRALCVASGEGCAGFHRQQPCLIARDEQTHSSGASFLLFRVGGSESLVVERRSDGTVAITALRDLEAGVGLSVGGRFGLGRRAAGDGDLVDADRRGGGVALEATAGVEARLRGGWGDTWELPDRAAGERFLRRYVAWRRAGLPGGDERVARRGVGPPRTERVRIGADGTLTGAVSGPLGVEASGTAIAGLRGEGSRDRRSGRTTVSLALPASVAGQLAGPLSLKLGGGLRVEPAVTLVLDRDLRPRELRLVGQAIGDSGTRRRDYQLRLDLTRPELAAELRALVGALVRGRPAGAARAAGALGRRAREEGWVDEREYRTTTTADGFEGELALGLRVGFRDQELRSLSRLVAARTLPPGGVWEARPDCAVARARLSVRSRPAAEAAAVGRRGGADDPGEVRPQDRGVAEAAGGRDGFDRAVVVLEQLAGQADPLLGDPAGGRGAGLVPEAAGERPLADLGVAGERGHVERLIQVPLGPAAGALQVDPAAARRRDRARDELGLTAVAVRGHHRPAGHRRRDLGAQIAAHDVQAQVQPRGHAGAGQHGALVDVEHVGVDRDAGELGREAGGVVPVGRRAAAVEQAGVGEGEGAGADRHHARAAGGGPAQGVQDRGGRRDGRRPAVAGDDDRVGVLQRLEPVGGSERDPDAGDRDRWRSVEIRRAGSVGGRRGGRHAQLVVRAADVAEQVAGGGQVQQDDVGQGEGDHQVRRLRGRAVGPGRRSRGGRRHMAGISRTWSFLPLATFAGAGEDRPMPHAQVLIYDGFDELDAIAPFEVLSAAGFDCELVVLAGEHDPGAPVTATHGLRVLPDGELAAAPDVLLVPGGGWAARAAAGTWAEHERGVLPAAIAARHAAGSVIASVCTGAMLLARAGLLEGRPAVTHRIALADLAAAGADVRPHERVVDDGDVVTGGGVTSGLDVALRLVERFSGPDAARFGALRMEYVPQAVAAGG